MLLRQASRRQLSPLPSPALWRQFATGHHLTGHLDVNLERRHPAFDDLSKELRALPTFSTRGRDVRVMYEPQEFYQTLLQRIATAKRRIFIASLYVGKNETELIETIHTALRNNPTLEVVFVVDYLRSTREMPKPSSAALVATLQSAFPKQVEVRLYHTPDLPRWVKRLLPRRLNEGWGLQHMKCYGFDDTVIISGANLSNDYFTNRQDRYLEFMSNPPLADYFHSLLKVASNYSFVATATDTSSKSPALSITWPASNPVLSPLAKPESRNDFKAHAGDSFSAFTRKWSSKPRAALCSTLPWSPHEPQTYDTILRPVLQMGPFGVTQETDLAVPSIFRAGNSLATAPGGHRSKIDWTSGYFSVQPAYLEHVLNSKAAVRIVTASPQANGFLNSKGISRFVPPAYTHLTKEFYEKSQRQAAKRRRESLIDIREWRREGWTYHAKGIWLTPSLSSLIRSPLDASPLTDPDERNDEITINHPLAPYLTLVGSSNYGRRSATRDLEASLLLTTFSKELRADLQEEILQIRQYAVDHVNEALLDRKDRIVPWGVKVAAKVIEDML